MMLVLGRLRRTRSAPLSAATKCATFAPMNADVQHVLTILAVEDVGAAAAFYRTAFDWALAVETPAYVEFTLQGGQRIGLYEREGFGRNTGRLPAKIPSGQLAPTELYFYADDLDEAIARIKRAGARELSPLTRRDWGDEAAYFADPSGNVLVLAQPAPVEGAP
jgi:predicted enzyme related to lactoylglutathione lyase